MPHTIMEPPTVTDWIVNNPGKSINDYYAKFPARREQTASNSFSPPEITKRKVASNRSLIISSVVCSIGFIGYFSPWFSIPVLRLSISGHEVMQLINFIVGRNEDLENIQDYVKLLYLIPVTYVIIVLGAALRSFFLTGLGTVLNILIVGLILKCLFSMSSEMLNSVTFGLYLIIISALGQVYNIFTLQFDKPKHN